MMNRGIHAGCIVESMLDASWNPRWMRHRAWMGDGVAVQSTEPYYYTVQDTNIRTRYMHTNTECRCVWTKSLLLYNIEYIGGTHNII